MYFIHCILYIQKCLVQTIICLWALPSADTPLLQGLTHQDAEDGFLVNTTNLLVELDGLINGRLA